MHEKPSIIISSALKSERFPTFGMALSPSSLTDTSPCW